MIRSKRQMLSFVVLAASFALTLATAGCTTAPGAAAAPAVTCKLLSPQEIRTYAPARALNPFIAHTSLLQGAPDEFVVLEVDLSLSESTQVSLAASVENEAGNEVAGLWNRKQMHAYWDHLQDVTDRDDRIRQDTLDRYYPPASEFAARRGQTTWILVLVGKNPLPRPATVKVSVSLNGAEAEAFSFPLPPPRK
jgi:hypothetical protein